MRNLFLITLFFSTVMLNAQTKEELLNEIERLQKEIEIAKSKDLQKDSINDIIKTHYKESYSTVFSCVVKNIPAGFSDGTGELLGGVIVQCIFGEYEKGYEDGYANKPPKNTVSLVQKLFKTGRTISSTASTANVTAEELSYNQGYTDGEKDRKKEGR